MTLKQIALQAEVSPMTASRVLRGIGRVSPHTRNRVRQVAKQLGYRRLDGVVLPSPVLRGTSDHSLRLTICQFRGQWGVESELGRRVLHGLRERLEASSGRLQIEMFDHIEQAVAFIKEQQPHGVVLRQVLPRQWVDRLRPLLPVVYAVSHDFQKGVDCVYTNEQRSAADILDLLSSHGHRQIAWFGIIDRHAETHVLMDEMDDATTVDRHAASIVGVRHGAWANLAHCQIDHQKMPLLLLERDWRLQTLDEVIEQGVDRLLAERPQPTAIVVSTGSMGQSLLAALDRRGIRVPEEMSVVAYEGGEEAVDHVRPLTRIQLPMEDIGRVIPELIERRLANPDARALALQFETTLIGAGTVGPAPLKSGSKHRDDRNA